MHQIQPTVGQWYIRPESGLRFEVIEVGDGTIEIQDEEGTLDQVDTDTWFDLPVEPTDQPQDASPAFDNLAKPDEADGGDPVDVDADGTLLRIATSEMLDDSARPRDDVERDEDTTPLR